MGGGLSSATDVACDVVVVVLDALHIDEWPTVEHAPKLLAELVVAVHQHISTVSDSAIVAIRLSAKAPDRIMCTTKACIGGPEKQWVMEHTIDGGLVLPNPMETDLASARQKDCVVCYQSAEPHPWAYGRGRKTLETPVPPQSGPPPTYTPGMSSFIPWDTVHPHW